MTKYKVLFITIILDVTMLVFANAIDTLGTNGVDITELPTSDEGGLDFAFGIIETFKNIMTFQITGLPDMFYLFFIIINFVLIFIIAELVISAIKAIPFI